MRNRATHLPAIWHHPTRRWRQDLATTDRYWSDGHVSAHLSDPGPTRHSRAGSGQSLHTSSRESVSGHRSRSGPRYRTRSPLLSLPGWLADQDRSAVRRRDHPRSVSRIPRFAACLPHPRGSGQIRQGCASRRPSRRGAQAKSERLRCDRRGCCSVCEPRPRSYPPRARC